MTWQWTCNQTLSCIHLTFRYVSLTPVCQETCRYVSMQAQEVACNCIREMLNIKLK